MSSDSNGLNEVGAEEGTDNSNPKKTNRKFNIRGKYLVTILIVLLIGALVFLFIEYRQAKDEIAKLKDPQAQSKIEKQQILDKVGALVEIPSNEEPQMAEILDVSKFKDQPFFANAQNGDIVILYASSGKTIIYRPSTNKVIETAKTNLGTQK